MKIIGSSALETKVIDSINYSSNHKNAKSIIDEIAIISEKLSKTGFIENQLLENIKVNDSSYIAKLSLGEKIKSIHIYIGRNSVINDIVTLERTKDTLILPYGEIESFLNTTLRKLEQKGFALAKLKLINIIKKKHILSADLQFEIDNQRKLNSIVVKYADKNDSFPIGHLSQIIRKYHNVTFNQNLVNQIHDDFDKYNFVSQTKYPEILFTKDTTKVYVYLEKRKSNTFDGFVGFSNDVDKKLIFNGYLDLTLINTLKIGEQFSLYWKSDGNNQKTFKTSIELPYLFKSPIGLKAQIYIFKQDSTFQNTKTALDLGYFLNYNSRLYLGYQSTESSDIQNINNNLVSDFKNSFITSSFDYSNFDFGNLLFPIKSNFLLTTGFGKRKSSNLLDAKKQFYINISLMHNFYLNKKNSININSHNYFLQSDTYIINELFRFGGVTSVRGFAENSLQANLVSSFLTEYRYIVSPSLYLHTITDYAHYQDKSTSSKENLIGFGFGIGLQTKNGILKFAIANGSAKSQEIKFYNTFVHICYNVKF